MSRSHGSGQPIHFKCSNCRKWRTQLVRDGALDCLAGRKFVATGERRRRFTTGGGPRIDNQFQYQYRCNDCGHVGWSRHVDVRRAYEKLQAETKAA